MSRIKYPDRKLGRYRKGVNPFPNGYGTDAKPKRTPDKNGKYKMESDYEGLCAICGAKYYPGVVIYFDPKKPAGQKCAHAACYEQRANA